MHVDINTTERRQHPRTLSHTEAIVSSPHGVHRYTVSNLSVAGALLVDGPALRRGEHVEITLLLPLYPEVRVRAQVVRIDDGAIGLAFQHVDDRTEDHIQSALLSEIERSQTGGRIADIV
ncbi:MAG: PilZ domain-containing protein [Nannocystaceae bacterium]|nr:PilZ domain-containing protein [Nannocystaceae bacterium]